MHPLAQYVDLIALLAYLLDPLALFFGHLTKRKNGSKKMLTESQFARFMMFSTTCARRSQALISITPPRQDSSMPVYVYRCMHVYVYTITDIVQEMSLLD